MTAYKVVAPYVTLKVQADDGSEVVKGFYAGAIVDAVDEDQAKAQADMGLLEKASRAEAKAAESPEEPKKPAATK
jgi:hypothetical protein